MTTSSRLTPRSRSACPSWISECLLGIDVGRVDEIDARLDCASDNRRGGLLIERAEGSRAQNPATPLKVIVPRQISETYWPVRPRWSIAHERHSTLRKRSHVVRAQIGDWLRSRFKASAGPSNRRPGDEDVSNPVPASRSSRRLIEPKATRAPVIIATASDIVIFFGSTTVSRRPRRWMWMRSATSNTMRHIVGD